MASEKVTAVKAMRLKTGLNQTDFWKEVGVMQAASSRYENGIIEVPEHVTRFLNLRYGKAPIKALASLRKTTIDQLITSGK